MTLDQASSVGTASSLTPKTDRQLHRTAIFWLFSAFIVHTVLVFRFPLAPDESYYWDWSRNLSLGYYDQGPLIAWVIRASCSLFGETAFGIRIGIVLVCSATQIFLYLLARDLCGLRVGLISLAISTITPLALAGSFIATYDPLVVLFWSSAMYFAARALFFNSVRSWAGVGLSLGLGLLSKHSMVFFVPCVGLFLGMVPSMRIWFRKPQPYLAFLLAIAIYSPNLIWQSQNDWITFRHLFVLTGKGLDYPWLRRLGDFLGSQIALMSPLLFFGMIAALIWAGRQARKPNENRIGFLFCMSAPVLCLFVAMTIKSKVQANWSVCGWLAPPIIWAAWLEQKAQIAGKTQTIKIILSEKYTLASLTFCLFLSMVLVWSESRVVIHVVVPPRLDQMNKLYGGEEVGLEVSNQREIMKQQSGEMPIIGATTYDVTSRLSFYTPGQPRARCFFLGTRMNAYGLWRANGQLAVGTNAVIVDDFGPGDPKLPPIREIFDRVEPVSEPVQAWRKPLYKEPVHTYYLYRCYGYHPNPEFEVTKGG